MSVIVTDTGFTAEDWQAGFAAPDAVQEGQGVELAPDADLDHLALQLLGAPIVRIRFPSFSDGRGFTLARLLRARGFEGRLRAVGHVISDQYAMARRAGFDEVEISEDLAKRQPQAEWVFRADWTEMDHRARLRTAPETAAQSRAA